MKRITIEIEIELEENDSDGDVEYTNDEYGITIRKHKLTDIYEVDDLVIKDAKISISTSDIEKAVNKHQSDTYKK